MATSGQWLENALGDLCKQMETGWGLDKEMISGLVSYCELAQPQDAKEYLDNIIGQEVGKNVIDEYLRLRGHSDLCSKPLDVPTSNLQAYVKPPSYEGSFGGSKKPVNKTPKTISIASKEIEPKKVASSSNVGNQVSSEARNSSSGKGNQISSKKKKAAKVISLAEAAKGSIVFQQGKPCSCQARNHRLVSNCLSCGKIVCEQEGEGPCSFCGSLVLREGSTYAGMDEGFTPLSDAEAVAEAYAKRLVEYDRNSAARTSVIDDQSDYYQIEGNSWLSNEEKELLKKKQEEIEEAERAKRNKVVVTFDMVGRKVLLNEDDASELESHNNIMRRPDEREVNRIKPNPSLQIHPVFVDPGPREKSTKSRNSNKTVSRGICLEITGRVQHDRSNELKNSMVENELETSFNRKAWQGPSVNHRQPLQDNNECFLDAH